jgi:hypothetical protein
VISYIRPSNLLSSQASECAKCATHGLAGSSCLLGIELSVSRIEALIVYLAGAVVVPQRNFVGLVAHEDVIVVLVNDGLFAVRSLIVASNVSVTEGFEGICGCDEAGEERYGDN